MREGVLYNFKVLMWTKNQNLKNVCFVLQDIKFCDTLTMALTALPLRMIFTFITILFSAH